MPRWVKPISVLATLLVAILGIETRSEAHPHAWIDLRSTVVLDEDSRVTGLRVHWIFDEFYTLFTLDVIDPDRDGKADPELVRKLAEGNLKNLAAYAYFTYVKVNGEQPEYGPVVDYESYLDGDRLIMEFVVPLVEPVDPTTQRLSYAVYDPTYYIEVFHVDTQSFGAEGPMPAGCALDLEPPNPDPAMVSLAAALDKTESGGDGLGAFFAEQVHLRCQ